MGAIFDTAIAPYLPNKASTPAIDNAYMLLGLPSVLLLQTVIQSFMPQISLHAHESDNPEDQKIRTDKGWLRLKKKRLKGEI